MSAETLDVAERQRIARLLVKEVQASGNTITIHRSIPIPGSPQAGPDPSKPGSDINDLIELAAGTWLFDIVPVCFQKTVRTTARAFITVRARLGDHFEFASPEKTN